MKISEIKNKELRELAELRRSQCDENEVYDDVDSFWWDETPEGYQFWEDVRRGKITRFTPPKSPKQWLDERGTLEVGSTMYNLVLTILEDYAKTK